VESGKVTDRKKCKNCIYIRRKRNKFYCSNNIQVTNIIGVDIVTASNLLASGGKVQIDEDGTCEYWSDC